MSPLPATIDIDDSDIIIRRVPKTSLDEDGYPNQESFSLRPQINEVSLSFNALKLLKKPINALDGINNASQFYLYKLEAIDAKNLKMGVCHTPSSKVLSHVSICGYYTTSKIDTLRKKAVQIL